MKDHQISILVNDIRDALNNRLIGVKLPQCIRTIISEAVVDSLIKQGLKIDHK